MEPPILYGKYQLLERIAKGGMAEVYKAKSFGVEGFEKILVIKRILPALTENERFVEMFINEAKISVSLNHANIVQVFDLGRMDDSYFIAMEYVQGYDLATVNRHLTEQDAPWPLELAVFIISEVAKGLDYAHRRRDQNLNAMNIVHRDISPHNILISLEGEVKITDFGIAKAKTVIEDEEKGLIKGKYAYMAPEQALGQDIDSRADIYSCGVILYRLLAGRNPFRGVDFKDAIRRARHPECIPIEEAAPHVPAELVEIVKRTMALKPGDRYPSAARLYEDLIAFLFSTGRRVGAHDLAQFMEEAHRKIAAPRPEVEIGRAIAEAVGGGSTVSSSISHADYGPGEITAVQVKLPSQVPPTDEKSALPPSSRRVAARKRDVTALAVEILSPDVPEEIRKNIEEVIVADGGHIVESHRDFIVSLFGMTIADGRDTEAAVRCALKIQRLLSLSDQGRNYAQGIGLGIHPKQVVILPPESIREDDLYFALISRARSLASRGIGWIIASPEARRFTSRYFRFEPLETLTGEEEDFRVIGSRTRRELYGRFFGRKEELRTIGEILALVNSGSPRILGIRGDPGIGKTRLLHEVLDRLAQTGHPYGWYEAGIPPHQKSVPYLGVSGMLRKILALEEMESLETLGEKVERLRQLGLGPEEIHTCGGVLGLPVSARTGPEERSRSLLGGLSKIATRLAHDRLSVFAWDSADSLDDESISLLEGLAADLRSGRILLVFTFREDFSTKLFELPNAHTLAVDPLSESETGKLALEKLAVRSAADDLLSEIYVKSRGNPLYVEEFTQALQEAHQIETKDERVSWHPERGEIELPKTLQGLVSSRLERLPAETQTMLQRASVIGLHIDLRILADVCGLEIASLRGLFPELIERGIVAHVSGEEYAFASDVLRDVLYERLLPPDRREIHLAIARAVEKVFRDRLDQHYPLLALHYREAGEAHQAAEYFMKAGRKVASDYSHRMALDHYLEALSILEGLPDTDRQRKMALHRVVAETALGVASTRIGLENIGQAIVLAEEIDDRRTLVSLFTLKGQLLVRDDRFNEAKVAFSRALELAENFAEPAMRRDVLSAVGELYFKYGDFVQARALLEEAIALSVATGSRFHEIQALCILSEGTAMAGEPDPAAEYLARAELLAADHPDPALKVRVLKARGMGAYMKPDYREALATLERLRELSSEYGFRLEETIATHNMGDIHLNEGDYKRAYTYLRLTMDLCREHHFASLGMITEILLAFIDALKFDSREGLERLERMLVESKEKGTIWEQVQAHFFLGRIYLEKGRLGEAREHLEAVCRIGDESGNKIYNQKAMDLCRIIDRQAGEDPAEKT